ncbi:MAG: biotin/lipoyl-binding protein [Saprospiraceae bacterium]|nr:biotin/lipoyl-binding protein [Saprospiraceae bacterium]
MDNYKIWINDHTYDLTGADIVSIEYNGEKEIVAVVGNRRLPGSIVEVNYKKKEYVVEILGRFYHIRIQNPYDRLIDDMGYAKRSSKGSEDIKAPMPGLVLEILVSPGQEVSKGDPVIVLEAMKMENMLKSHHDGIVKNVSVSKGLAVEKGQVLIEIE